MLIMLISLPPLYPIFLPSIYIIIAEVKGILIINILTLSLLLPSPFYLSFFSVAPFVLLPMTLRSYSLHFYTSICTVIPLCAIR